MIHNTQSAQISQKQDEHYVRSEHPACRESLIICVYFLTIPYLTAKVSRRKSEQFKGYCQS